jgi:hypothetical protein
MDRLKQQGAAKVASLPMFSRERGTEGTTDPMPFPHIPLGDIISVMSRRLGHAK